MSNNKSDSENDDISGPRPRLCHLRKWSHFQGYGFNLHAEKTRNGQSIGKVDPNSPAESAGLKEKDRIIEVNYVNISNENHQQVVKRIRCGLEINGQVIENEVVLLVVDPEADEYYKKRNIVVKHDFKNVLRLETPPETQLNSNNKTLPPPESSPQVSSHRNSVSSTSEHNNSTTEINNNNFDKISNDYRYTTNTNTSQNEKVSTPSTQNKSLNYEKVSPPQTPLSTKSNGSVSSSSTNKDTQSNKSSSTTNTMNNNNHHNSNSSNNNNNSANPFAMSAAEYKQFLKTNKQKSDPRNVHVDIKQKYQIFQNM